MTSTPDLASTATTTVAGAAPRTLTYAAALNEALREAMRRDPAVFCIGEDIAIWGGGGVYGVTRGLVEEFGPERVRDTPVSEEAIVGLSVGAALLGLRPVAEIMYSDFLTLAMDPIVNQAAKMRYMFGGQASVPMVVRTNSGVAGQQGGPALAVARGVVHAHPRPQGRHAVDAGRRQGAPGSGDPRRQPGHLPRAQAAVCHERAGPGR